MAREGEGGVHVLARGGAVSRVSVEAASSGISVAVGRTESVTSSVVGNGSFVHDTIGAC